MAIKRSGKFAIGRKSKAIDDRTGRKVNYQDLRKEWTGLMVHKDEWESKHPQLRPRSAVDAEALKNARVDRDIEITHVRGSSIRGVTIYVYGARDPLTAGLKITGSSITSSVGTEIPTVSPTPSGISATMSVGNVAGGIGVAGSAVTVSVGNETAVALVLESGLAITASVGSVAGGIGVAGSASTFSIGTINLGGWGAQTWSSGPWSDK